MVRYFTFISQFGGRHEDFFNPENSCVPWAKQNFLGWKKSSCLPTNWEIIVYYTESLRSTYYRGNMHWIEVLHTLAYFSFNSCLVAIASAESISHLYPYKMSSYSHVCTYLQGSRIPLSRCPGKVKSTSGIVQNKSVLTRRESQHNVNIRFGMILEET